MLSYLGFLEIAEFTEKEKKNITEYKAKIAVKHEIHYTIFLMGKADRNPAVITYELIWKLIMMVCCFE